MPDDADHLQLHLRWLLFPTTSIRLRLPEHQQGILERHLRPGELVVPHREGVPVKTFRSSSSGSRRDTYGFGITYAHVNLQHYTEKGDREV